MDAATAFDEYTIKRLEAIAGYQPSLTERIIENMGLIPPVADRSQREVTEAVVRTASAIGAQTAKLLADSFEQSHGLDRIQATLDRIKEVALDELGDLPRYSVLGALWLRLVRPDDHASLKAHQQLLTDMGGFYDGAAHVMGDAAMALNRIEAELEGFRDDYAVISIEQYPLEAMIPQFRMARERIESAQRRFDVIEDGRNAR
jgi:hypothetical protein